MRTTHIVSTGGAGQAGIQPVNHIEPNTSDRDTPTQEHIQPTSLDNAVSFAHAFAEGILGAECMWNGRQPSHTECTEHSHGHALVIHELVPAMR